MTHLGMALMLLVAVGAGCRGPSPRPDVHTAADVWRHTRIERTGEALLPGSGVRWSLSSSREPGAWAWPDGRIEVSRALADRLDADELAAALAHELGHLLDGGHLSRVAQALDGGAGDVERRADRIGCTLLARHGIPPEAMSRMLAKVAAASRARAGELVGRIAAARDVCASASATR